MQSAQRVEQGTDVYFRVDPSQSGWFSGPHSLWRIIGIRWRYWRLKSVRGSVAELAVATGPLLGPVMIHTMAFQETPFLPIESAFPSEETAPTPAVSPAVPASASAEEITIVQQNVWTAYLGKECFNVWKAESVSVNAGPNNQVAVNGVVDRDGRIVTFGSHSGINSGGQAGCGCRGRLSKSSSISKFSSIGHSLRPTYKGPIRMIPWDPDWPLDPEAETNF